MSYSLVIVESSSKCKTIESYLGSGYKVVACLGHLRHIADLQAIDTSNGFRTTYTLIPDTFKLKQVEYIKKEISKAKEVILATDDDREGESIAWHLCDLFGLSVTKTKRIVFHEITEPAIHAAMCHSTTINMDLVHAQQARQIIDLLVGYTFSPILWKHFSLKGQKGSLSAGRCQTPALRLVYDNHLAIQSSAGKKIYCTTGYFTNLHLPFDLNTTFDTSTKAKEFLELCSRWEFIYTIVPKKEKVIKAAPTPLTTSILQQLASNELHLSPKETMKHAQQLYESGLITYMRTDSTNYSPVFIEKAQSYISSTYGETYIRPDVSRLSVEGSNDLIKAHEAIRVVNVHWNTPQTKEVLSSKVIKLYHLIWKRTLQSCMASAEYHSSSAKLSAPLDTEFLYKTEYLLFAGWQVVEKEKETNLSNAYTYLHTLKPDIAMTPSKVVSTFTIRELISHYTEARLVQVLEEKGIGRPSTFASLVDKIQERKYVEKTSVQGIQVEDVEYSLDTSKEIKETCVKKQFGNEKNKLVIQPLGIQVIEFLIAFEPFFNYDYTNQMEDALDKIATSNASNNWTDVCATCYEGMQTFSKDLQDPGAGELQRNEGAGELQRKEEPGELQRKEAPGELQRKKETCIIRELNAHASIRKGKYGDYLYYKRPQMKRPRFFNFKGFEEDYVSCDATLLLNWVKRTHRVECV